MKVNTEDTISGFHDFFLQPIIKDRPNIVQNLLAAQIFVSFSYSTILRFIINIESLPLLEQNAFLTNEISARRLVAKIILEGKVTGKFFRFNASFIIVYVTVL